MVSKPVAKEKEFLSLLRFPKIRLDELRRRYQLYIMHTSDSEEKITRESYLEGYRNRIRDETRTVKKFRTFFGHQRSAFQKYIRRLEKESIVYLADLLAKNANRIYIIEVKSTRGGLPFLKVEKLKGIMLTREYGFIPAIVSLNLKIEATNFKMMKIS